MAKQDPIGVFDSGVGGLAVVQESRKLLPQEDILYYADQAHFPYGQRSPQEVTHLASDATRFLLDRGAKMVVVACNTASGVALDLLRAAFPVPFVGVEPAIRPASAQSHSRKVGVMATDATFHTQRFARLVTQYAEDVEVYTQECPNLVELVEAGDVESRQVRSLLHRYLDPLVAEGIDALALGCTHYSFLRQAIQEVVGPGVAVIDTALPVARQVERVLKASDLAREDGVPGRVQLFTSGDEAAFLTVVRRLLPEGMGLPLGQTIKGLS